LGELAIVLNASASGNGSSGPTVETRNGGIQKVEVDFDAPVNLVNPTGVTVTGYITSAGVMGSPSPYIPNLVSMVDSDTIQILFNAGVLPDEGCYTITIAAGTISENLFGDTDCNIRSLVGDANGNGTVNTTDQSVIKSKISPPINVSTGPQYDVNLSGAINTTDQSLVKSRVTAPAKTALCP
jgi:hypothetical protein